MVKFSKTTFRIPPQFYFVISAIFHYLGPSFAVLLFQRISVDGVAWLRIVSAAVVFAIWRRPWRFLYKIDIKAKMIIAALGLDFALMNYSFYYAIDALPLGSVSAIEFIGPTLLALIGSRSLRNFLAATLAISGVYIITDFQFEGEPIGIMWAFINAVLFFFYIILAHNLASLSTSVKPIDRLALSILVAALFITPLGIKGALPAFNDITLVLAGLGVGISSSLIPYVFDQLALIRISKATYSILVSLLPAVAVIIGYLILDQVPSRLEIIAVALIVFAVLFTKTE